MSDYISVVMDTLIDALNEKLFVPIRKVSTHDMSSTVFFKEQQWFIEHGITSCTSLEYKSNVEKLALLLLLRDHIAERRKQPPNTQESNPTMNQPINYYPDFAKVGFTHHTDVSKQVVIENIRDICDDEGYPTKLITDTELYERLIGRPPKKHIVMVQQTEPSVEGCDVAAILISCGDKEPVIFFLPNPYQNVIKRCSTAEETTAIRTDDWPNLYDVDSFTKLFYSIGNHCVGEKLDEESERMDTTLEEKLNIIRKLPGFTALADKAVNNDHGCTVLKDHISNLTNATGGLSLDSVSSEIKNAGITPKSFEADSSINTDYGLVMAAAPGTVVTAADASSYPINTAKTITPSLNIPGVVYKNLGGIDTKNKLAAIDGTKPAESVVEDTGDKVVTNMDSALEERLLKSFNELQSDKKSEPSSADKKFNYDQTFETTHKEAASNKPIESTRRTNVSGLDVWFTQEELELAMIYWNSYTWFKERDIDSSNKLINMLPLDKAAVLTILKKD